jgi:hypothetical protein
VNRLLPLLLQEAEFYTISWFGGFMGWSCDFRCPPHGEFKSYAFLFMSLVAVDLLIHPRLLVCFLAFFFLVVA